MDCSLEEGEWRARELIHTVRPSSLQQFYLMRGQQRAWAKHVATNHSALITFSESCACFCSASLLISFGFMKWQDELWRFCTQWCSRPHFQVYYVTELFRFDNMLTSPILKPRLMDRNISTQHIVTLLGATCCVRLATLFYVRTCWVFLAQI